MCCILTENFHLSVENVGNGESSHEKEKKLIIIIIIWEFYKGYKSAFRPTCPRKNNSYTYTYIDASYEEKHCSRSWTKTSTAQNLGRKVTQLKISDEEKHNSGRADEEKQNSRRPDEEKHDSDERTSTIYCILINSTPYG